jgi:hypothetical protein
MTSIDYMQSCTESILAGAPKGRRLVLIVCKSSGYKIGEVRPGEHGPTVFATTGPVGRRRLYEDQRSKRVEDDGFSIAYVLDHPGAPETVALYCRSCRSMDIPMVTLRQEAALALKSGARVLRV